MDTPRQDTGCRRKLGKGVGTRCDGTDGHFPGRQLTQFPGGELCHGLEDGVGIVGGFSHAHKDDIGNGWYHPVHCTNVPIGGGGG